MPLTLVPKERGLFLCARQRNAEDIGVLLSQRGSEGAGEEFLDARGRERLAGDLPHVWGRFGFVEELQGAYAVPPDFLQEIEGAERGRVKTPLDALPDLPIVREEIVEKRLHMLAVGFAGRAQRQRERDRPRRRRSEPGFGVEKFLAAGHR